MIEIKPVKVAWGSDREREVATALGFRLRDGKVEMIRDGVISSVRPATGQEVKMWVALIRGAA